MALPLQEAQRIATEINKEFGFWGWKAEVIGSENEVIVRSDEDSGHFGFAWKLSLFTEIVKGWSITFMLHEGKLAIVIW